MLTRDEIHAVDDHLDDVAKAMLVPLIRNSNRYKSNPAFYAGFEANIDSASGTVKGKQINAMLAKIEELGVGESSLKGFYGDALNYSQIEEREAMVNYILSVLYETVDSSNVYDPDNVVITDSGTSIYTSTVLVGQRGNCNEFI